MLAGLDIVYAGGTVYMLVYENRTSIMNFFSFKEFFQTNFDLKNWGKMVVNLRIKTENHEAYPEIWFLTKSILKPYGRATAMPPAWELGERPKVFVSHILELVGFKLFSRK